MNLRASIYTLFLTKRGFFFVSVSKKVKFGVFPTILSNNFYSGCYVEVFSCNKQILGSRYLLKSNRYFNITRYNLIPVILAPNKVIQYKNLLKFNLLEHPDQYALAFVYFPKKLSWKTNMSLVSYSFFWGDWLLFLSKISG